ncbi:hypothetical protein HX109_00615 [Galbibacter sp. BG1]|uniref:hypothetical protein n=1 Tax=Galbibacter sp. BG1 TaxID=1170699 RepID=UPI0015BA41C4|nr:hypothetical protein [Galbibacter sp. BG1]QLE00132.1 hypothetical protein HX109_00615 [Galbibacter sp. BG1]
MTPESTEVGTSKKKTLKISWAAILGGCLASIAIIILLNLLGIGIGLSTLDFSAQHSPFYTLGIGAIIWWAISHLLVLFVGGFLAARMSGFHSNIDGAMHGFLAWALYVLLIFFFLILIGGVNHKITESIFGSFNNVHSKNGSVGMEMVSKKCQEETDLAYLKIKRQAYRLINANKRSDLISEETPADTLEFPLDSRNNLKLEEEIESFFNDISYELDESGDLSIRVGGSENFFDRSSLKVYLSKKTHLSGTDINDKINKWENNLDSATQNAQNKYTEAKMKAIEYANKRARAISKYYIITFLIFLLGAAVAILGGAIGSPENTAIDKVRIKRIEIEHKE